MVIDSIGRIGLLVGLLLGVVRLVVRRVVRIVRRVGLVLLVGLGLPKIDEIVEFPSFSPLTSLLVNSFESSETFLSFSLEFFDN